MRTRVLQPRFYDVFEVIQLGDHIPWSGSVAIDHVHVPPGQSSRVHRHEEADTYLLILGGKGEVVIGDEAIAVSGAMLLHIAPGVDHGVRTMSEALTFVSVQSPPILHPDGRLDLIPRAPQ